MFDRAATSGERDALHQNASKQFADSSTRLVSDYDKAIAAISVPIDQ
jgi:hypothetical protein